MPLRSLSTAFVLVAFALLVLSPLAIAQEPLAFTSTTYDFGGLAEGDVVTTTFAFTNTGATPVQLVEVRPSCGCTAPDWSREPVEPGATGSITVAYDSEGRPGRFSRDILVRAEDAGGPLDPVTLTITGEVTVTSLAGGSSQGNLLFDADAHDFGLVSPGRVVHRFLVQNQGDRPIHIRDAATYGGDVEVLLPETPLFVGDLREILVAVNTDVFTREAFDIAVVLDTTDENQPKKSLRLTGQMDQGD